MKSLFLSVCLLAATLLFIFGVQPPAVLTGTATVPEPASPADTNLIMFGRGTYPGDDTTYEQLKQSGFTTIMLSSFYIRSNGDVFSGDDGKNPIIHDGKYVGNKEWLKRVASLKKGNTSVNRIEILLEGRWYNQPPNTFDFIQDWATNPSKSYPGVVTGTGKNSTLYKIVKVMKDVIGVDAFCIDDESVYNSASIVQLGQIAGKLKMHMTLCPYTKAPYWKEILNGSKPGLIDAIYLQCYDGGTGNTPAPWVKNLDTKLPVYPIFLCRGAFSTCAPSHNSKTPDEIKAEMVQFKKDYPGITGGAIWQMVDVKGYVKRGCAVEMPESGSATTVTGYLAQLKNSIKTAL